MLYVAFCCLRVYYTRQAVSSSFLSFHLSNVMLALQRDAVVLQSHGAPSHPSLEIYNRTEDSSGRRLDPFTMLYCLSESRLILQGTRSEPKSQLCLGGFRQRAVLDERSRKKAIDILYTLGSYCIHCRVPSLMQVIAFTASVPYFNWKYAASVCCP